MIQHCLEPDPARRYQSGTELQEDIERHLSNFSIKHGAGTVACGTGRQVATPPPGHVESDFHGNPALVSLLLICSASWFAFRDASRAKLRVDYLAFHESFERAQLLLNTVHDGSSDHVIRGIQLAETVMSPYLKTGAGDLDSCRGFQHLPRDDQTALRGELAELLMMEVRARVVLVEQTEAVASRRQVYDWGIERLEAGSRLSTLECRPRSIRTGASPVCCGAGRRGGARPGPGRSHCPLFRSRHYLLGTSLLALGQPDRAEISLSRAVALNPRQFWTWFALGICHSDQG